MMNKEDQEYLDKAAIAAMGGICANEHTFWDSSRFQGDPKAISEEAYDIAQAMLAEKKRRAEDGTD